MIVPKYYKDSENTSLIFFYAEILKNARIGIRARWRSKSWEVVSGVDPLTCCLYDFAGSFLTSMSLCFLSRKKKKSNVDPGKRINWLCESDETVYLKAL